MLQYLSIRDLGNIDQRKESTQQLNTRFRTAEGVLPYPMGALSTMPEWAVWIDLAATVDAGISTLDLTSSDYNLLVLRETNQDDAKSGLIVFISAPSGSDYRDRGSLVLRAPVASQPAFTAIAGFSLGTTTPLPWYASRIGSEWWLGDGSNSNRVIDAEGTISLLEADPGDIYDKSRDDFPPCLQWQMGSGREVYGAGNVNSPMRVWVTAKPGNQHGPVFHGIESLETSYVDIVAPHATRITALSAFGPYITVHTDRGLFDLFGHPGGPDGFKAVQRSSIANAGAANPDCVKDITGLASYFLGTDGGLYNDESVRTGPFDKRRSKRTDVAPLDPGAWNGAMDKTMVSEQATRHVTLISGILSNPLLFNGDLLEFNGDAILFNND